jgi:toxin ParE1/3/4
MRLRTSASADADLVQILEWSELRFGAAGRRRYRALLVQALQDLRANPTRLGSRAREELGPGVRLYPVRLSRRRVHRSVGAVREPRHVVVNRIVAPDLVQVGRVLHDAMDPGRHVAAGDFEA